MANTFLFITILFALPQLASAQHHPDQHGQKEQAVAGIDAQPLLAQALRLRDALSFLGSSLSPADEKRLTAIQKEPRNAQTVKKIQQILDPYCLAVVRINPEARVKVERAAAPPTLMQNGWTSFLVKVYNDAGVTAPLNAESRNALRPVHVSSLQHRVQQKDIISKGESADRFLELQMYRGRPLQANLSGLKLEYAVVQLYSKDAGRREAEIGFNVGQGTQDIGFRNTTDILFDIRPAVRVNLNIKDHDGSPTMASLTITDSIERISGRLSNVYPLPSRRVAALDEYPDFFFQQHVYRQDGEHISLPPGKYHITYSRGPEYIPQTKTIVVPENADDLTINFRLKRWINLSALGYHSGDHHVHAAGCSHYDSPEEGVPPRDMWRQALGEDLNVSSVLTWGPSWYHQKHFFTGRDDSLSTNRNIMRYDVEVSGFPSSHAGHIVLLRLKEDDYPGTTQVEEWPSWTVPILKWAKSQGAVVGYAHSGWGLEPVNSTDDLPNYELPKMDGIGANEYIVTVTQGLIDFYSLGDTPGKWELNMWYHTLNCGFRTRISGETDFPCITDQRVGMSRSYFKSDRQVSYDDYVTALSKGRSYVTEGGSHILDFAVNGQETGVNNSEISLPEKQDVEITATVAAYLPERDTPATENERKARLAGQYYWSIEWARIGATRTVPVELIFNGKPVDTVVITADGKPNKLRFSFAAARSGWLALRVLGSSHSNPVFVQVAGKPVVEKQSAEWCVRALDQCWKMKQPNIRKAEQEEAKQAYDKARQVYERMGGR